MVDRQAVVAGAGPVGLLAACFMAEQGWQVQVYEKRSVPAQEPGDDDCRAYMMDLVARGPRAMHAAGIDLAPLAQKAGGFAEFSHFGTDGKPVFSNKWPVDTLKPSAIMLYRDELASHLLSQAQRLHPNRMSVAFETEISGIDLDDQTITVSRAGAAAEAVHYDLLVGADGAGSVVRRALQRTLPHSFCTRYKHGAMFSCAPAPRDAADGPPTHTFNRLYDFPNGSILFNERGPGSSLRRIGLCLSKETVQQVGRGEFDGVLPYLEDERYLTGLPASAKAAARKLLLSQPAFCNVASWTKCSQLHGPRVVLLGDAGHTITPVLGQGCNSGLEDAHVFSQVLAQHPDDLDAALQQYTRTRLPDISALVSLNWAMSRVWTMVKTSDIQGWAWGHAWWALFRYQEVTRTLLHTAAPSVFAGPVFSSILSGEKPFRAMSQAMTWDLGCITTLLIGAAVFCVM